MPSRFRLRSALVPIAVTLLSLVAAEAAVRVAHRIRPLYLDRPRVYHPHPQFHHWHEPNATSTFRTVEFSTRQRTNAHGMVGREVPLEKPAGVVRIGMVGDSFVEGFTTDEEESIPYRLEARLQAAVGEGYHVLNFGSASFSPTLEYFMLRDLGGQFDLDFVVLLFHVTDVTDDARYIDSAVRNAEGEVIAIDGGTVSWAYELATHSALLTAVTQAARALVRANVPFDLGHTFNAMFKPEYNDADRAAWALSLSYLERIRDWCAEAGIPFLLVALPVGPQVEPVGDVHASTLGLFGDGGLLTSTRMQDTLRDWASDRGIAFLDLLPAARRYKAARPDEVLFFPRDQHFTPAGKVMAADAIFEAIVPQLTRP